MDLLGLVGVSTLLFSPLIILKLKEELSHVIKSKE